MATGYLHPGPILVVIVGAVPAVVLVALAHLAALLAVPSTPARAAAEPTEQDTRHAVLRLIQAQPVTVAELASITGRSRTTIVGHLTALTTAGAVRRDNQKRYQPVQRPHLVDDAGVTR